MTFTLVLLISVSILALFLTPYLLTVWISAFYAFKNENKNSNNTEDENRSVAILIPSHNEGEGILSNIKTIRAQKTKARVKTYILIKDETDSSWPFLKSKLASLEKDGVYIKKCAVSPKTEKLQLAIKEIESDFIAILDADHHPTSNWISSSLAKFYDGKIVAVQTRRKPTSTSTIFSFWDSLQNHLGNELYNKMLSTSGLSLFFTGTAAIFRAEWLKNNPFKECITEDTLLSFEAITQGNKIAYNDHADSYEEVAPDLSTYLFRRMRWSSGHNHAFFTSFKKVIKAPISHFQKIQLLFHGFFFLVPTASLTLITFYASFTFFQLPQNYQYTVVFFAVILALLLPSFLLSRRPTLLSAVTTFLIALPNLTLLSLLPMRYVSQESYYLITSFPYINKLSWVILFYALSPLLAPVLANVRLKLFPFRRIFIASLFYPFFLILDMWACTLGLFYAIFRVKDWGAIRRSHQFSSDHLPEELKATLKGVTIAKDIRFQFLAIALGVFFIVATLNEFIQLDRCGEKRAILWEPLFKIREQSQIFSVSLRKKVVDDTIKFETLINYSPKELKPEILNLKISLDGSNLLDEKVNHQNVTTINKEFTLPIDWKSHQLEVNLDSSKHKCERNILFTGLVTEIVKKQLLVNGEPFLIKGLIPSFNSKHTSSTVQNEFMQFKHLGVNSIRSYHPLTDEMKMSAASLKLFYVAQPDRSTWDNIEITNAAEQRLLIKRFLKLDQKESGSPFSLFNHLGNELEASHNNMKEKLSALDNTLRTVQENTPSLLSYSTFLAYHPFPVNLLGVNMLDSGNTYWEDAIKILAANEAPFYASEWGGFVAFFELPHPLFRAYRMEEQWKKLEQYSGLGGFFFQSHDNWAQPVNIGHNDPFNKELPDDNRGIFTQEGKPKLEKSILENLYNDIALTHIKEESTSEIIKLTLQLTNKREYKLSSITGILDTIAVFHDLTLLPKEKKVIEIKFPTNISSPVLTMNFETHHGLEGVSHNLLVIKSLMNEITPIDSSFVTLKTSQGKILGVTLSGRDVKFYIPPQYKSIKVNERSVPVKNSEVVVTPPVGAPWQTLSCHLKTLNEDGPFITPVSRKGMVSISCFIPQDYSANAIFVVEGVGASEAELRIEDQKYQLETHPYREMALNFREIGIDPRGKKIELLINRQSTTYIDEKSSPTGKEVPVILYPPRIFLPFEIDLSGEL